MLQRIWLTYQIPLALGYARTLHKAQGMTLRSRTLIDVNDVFFKDGKVPPAIIYTGISRARDIQQIKFVEGLNRRIFRVDKAKPDARALAYHRSIVEPYTPLSFLTD